MRKIQNIFTKGTTFVKNYYGLFIAVLLIIISAVFYKSISVLIANMICFIINKHGLFNGSILVYIILTTISLIIILTYYLFNKKIYRFFRFLKIEDGLEDSKKSIKKNKKLITVYFSFLFFFLSVPAIFIIYLKVILEEIRNWLLVFLFFLSSLFSTTLTILGSRLLNSSPYIFYSLIIILVIITIIKNVRKKIREEIKPT